MHGKRLMSYCGNCACSSGDRALASGARCAGSIPARRTMSTSYCIKLNKEEAIRKKWTGLKTEWLLLPEQEQV